MFFCNVNYFTYVDEPPTLYSLMRSIAPQGTHTQDLWKFGRQYFFNFNYNLNGINKELFEKMVLNHYITRRINFDTAELFRIQLENKLIEVLPKYNLLFKDIDFDIFNNGNYERSTSLTEHYADNSAEKNYTNENSNTSVNSSQITSGKAEITDTSTNTNNTNSKSTRKFSDTPQNFINEIDDGNYITEYENNENSNSSTVIGNNNTNSKQTEEIANKNLALSNNSRNYSNNKDSYYNKTNTIKENYVNTANKLDSIIKLEQEYNSIFTLLYKDLDCLFYGLV